MKAVPPEDDGPPISRPGALSRDELIELVERIQQAEGTEAGHHVLVRGVEQSVSRPGASDLIFWPSRCADGSSLQMSAVEIVDIALSYRPIELGS